MIVCPGDTTTKPSCNPLVNMCVTGASVAFSKTTLSLMLHLSSGDCVGAIPMISPKSKAKRNFFMSIFSINVGMVSIDCPAQFGQMNSLKLTYLSKHHDCTGKWGRVLVVTEL